MVAVAIKAHVAAHGWLCPGFERSPHPSRDLTGDHILPRSRGGKNIPNNIAVMCRSCNSRKGARATRDGRGGARTGPDARVPLAISTPQSFVG
jgi:5-methylcytosine-specific restriction endonuclease McrA